MKTEEHQKLVDKLFELEKELTGMIAETDNETLQNKFLEWMDQRAVCNEGYLKVMETIVEEAKQEKTKTLNQ